MLKSIDVLIGLTVIMLALSMAVTVITQFVTTLINSRGLYLHRGLTDLLSQLDPGLQGKVAKGIATTVLTHPLVNATWGRRGSVIHREEFTKLLMVLSSGDTSGGKMGAAVKDALTEALRKNGITDPLGTLKKIREVSLQLEAESPGLAAHVRHDLAILQEARSDLVAKVNGWFDQTMDRVAQRFTAHARMITFFAAAVVAVVLQVDTLLLVNRLAADDKLQTAFVQRAAEMPRKDAAGAPPDTSQRGETIDREYMAFLADHGLVTIPHSYAAWAGRWPEVNVFGVAVTALLLSLGAPFWYNALSRLLQLRSTLAVKDDEQRAARQGVDAGAGNAALPRDRPLCGERDDAVAVG